MNHEFNLIINHKIKKIFIFKNMENKAENQKILTVTEIFNKSVRVGMSGAKAMLAQVTLLMWMRTIMNYQYR